MNIVDEGCIILDKPVRLGEEWTISVWTKTPIDATNPEFRNLVAAQLDIRLFGSHVTKSNTLSDCA